MAETPAADHNSIVQPPTTLQFFRDLYPSDTDGWLTIFTADHQTKWYPTKNLKAATRYALRQVNTQNVWFGLGLRREQLKGGRGGKDDIITLPGFVGDIDLKHPVHKAENLPETVDEARKIFECIPLHFSYLVHTGYGLQPYWLFREPWVLSDQAERDAAEHLWRRLITTLQATAKRHGWHVDSTFSLDHVFRVPGTRNRNVPDDPVDVTLLINSPGTRYNPGDFEPYLIECDPTTNGHASLVHLPENLPPVDVRQLRVTRRVKYLILDGTDRLNPGKSPSRSEPLFGVLRALVSEGYDDNTIASILLDSHNKISEKPIERGRRWLEQEISRIRRKPPLKIVAANEAVDGSGQSEASPTTDSPEHTSTEEDSPEWFTQLSQTKDRIPRETLRNITLALQHIEPWATDCWYDEVRNIPMVGDQELDDTMVTKASLMIEAQVKIPIRSKSLVADALRYLCREKPRDLLREWLENLPSWDEIPRLDTWLQTYAHAPDNAYGRDVSRLLPTGMVARASDPGCQFRNVPILEGPENAGKTKLVRELATPEWYREVSHGLEGKEAHMRIKRAWVAELAELASLTKTEESRLKSFFTMNEDTYIPKFSNFEVTHKRRTVFVGTVNPEGDNAYLRGQTGNTRYLPIAVRDINVEGFQAIRTQLFAEALQYYRDHPDDWWKLSSDGETVAEEVREERRQRSVYEDDLGHWLERSSRKVTWWEEIATEHLSLPKDRWNRIQQMEVTKALKALGWWKDKRQRVSIGGESKLVVPWRPGDDWRTAP
jgi:predicted P-loop ATPase